MFFIQICKQNIECNTLLRAQHLKCYEEKKTQIWNEEKKNFTRKKIFGVQHRVTQKFETESRDRDFGSRFTLNADSSLLCFSSERKWVFKIRNSFFLVLCLVALTKALAVMWSQWNIKKISFKNNITINTNMEGRPEDENRIGHRKIHYVEI